MVRKLPTNIVLLGRAKRMRSLQTRAEELLWSQIRAKRFHGYKFRRQDPIGRYIVDFLCFKARLVVEVDGATHDGRYAQAYDRRRSAYLHSKGYRILRFRNEAVIESLDLVLEELLLVLQSPLPRPPP